MLDLVSKVQIELANVMDLGVILWEKGYHLVVRGIDLNLL